jgi:hypothetical protein
MAAIQHAPRLWQAYLYWRDAFAALLDPETHTIAWLDNSVAAGSIEIIAGQRSAALVSVKTYPTGMRELHGMCAVGDLDDLLVVVIPACEKWGKAMGCERAVIESRAGWARVMQSHGYSEHQRHIREAL